MEKETATKATRRAGWNRLLEEVSVVFAIYSILFDNILLRTVRLSPHGPFGNSPEEQIEGYINYLQKKGYIYFLFYECFNV